MAWCSRGRNLVWAVLCKVAEFITAITLCIRAVAAKMTYLSTNKAPSIIRHPTEHEGCQHGCQLLCCIEFFNYSDDFRQSLRVFFIYLGCGGVHIPKSFNKNADGCSVTVKGTSVSCCFEAVDVARKSFIIFLLYLHKV